MTYDRTRIEIADCVLNYLQALVGLGIRGEVALIELGQEIINPGFVVFGLCLLL